MPALPLSEAEVEDLVAFVLTLRPRDPTPASEAPARIASVRELTGLPRRPQIERPVHFEEVDRRVFHEVCWHCHSDPDYALGDGGPGNTGGFGFAPRGVHLASWEGVGSGYLDADGERRSLLNARGDALPLLLSALLARRVEEAGGRVVGVRGMPLGLPSLGDEELQIVESWLAQGAPY